MIYRILLESLCDELPESSLCHLLLNLTAPSAGSLLDTVELTWQLLHWNTLYINIIRLLPAYLLSQKKKTFCSDAKDIIGFISRSITILIIILLLRLYSSTLTTRLMSVC